MGVVLAAVGMVLAVTCWTADSGGMVWMETVEVRGGGGGRVLGGAAC